MKVILLLTTFYLAHAVIVEEADRIDCFPAPGATQYDCQSRRGCIWDSKSAMSIQSAPRCYYPPSVGYTQGAQSGNSIILEKKHSGIHWYGYDIEPLALSIEKFGETMHLKIVPKNQKPRYGPPIDIPKSPSTSTDSLEFKTKTNSGGAFAFEIIRSSTQRALWDTSIGGLIYADQFIQISTFLPSKHIYGFGENSHQNLKHDLNDFKTWPLFSRDEPPYAVSEARKNLYGVHPFYISLEPDGKAHGVLFLNSNAQEYVTAPSPSLTYRTIGGIIDLYFFPGPKPEQVVEQYLAFIGKPTLPAYWALGFQLCRWGYHKLDRVKAVVNRTLTAKIPYDVQWMDIDYMDHRQDFTYNKVNFTEMPEFVANLHKQGMRNVLILDPAIPADYDTLKRGMEKKVFVRWPDKSLVPDLNNKYESTKGSDVMLGTVWPDKNAAFPDWFAAKADEWWADEVTRFHDIVPFDGLWIDMNEPANFATNDPNPWYWTDRSLGHALTPQLFCPHDILDSPPYATWAVYYFQEQGDKIARLSKKTICMNGMHNNGQYRHYDVHSLYGFGESKATHDALTKILNKRSLLVSRSSFVSSGRYASHWLGDNSATWEDLRLSIIGILEFNFFGIPFVGADICGFNGDTNEELCLRWQQLGAFYPFSRNHNGYTYKPQDPGMWPTVASAAKKANEFRYHYLPYLYSLLYDSSMNGKTVARPLFFEFPHDSIAADIDQQFLWGDALLVSPVLKQGETTVKAYFPADVWYSLYDFDYGLQLSNIGLKILQAPWTSLIPVHVRGGRILPRQAFAANTVAARKNALEMLVALDIKNQASGFMYWDDGESLLEKNTENQKFYHYFKFLYAQNENSAFLNISSATNAQDQGVTIPTMDIIEILGYGYTPDWDSFKLNGNSVVIDKTKSNYDCRQKRMYLDTRKLIELNGIPVNQASRLTWSHVKAMC